MNNKNKYLYLNLINQVYMYSIYVDSVMNLYKLCVNSVYYLPYSTIYVCINNNNFNYCVLINFEQVHHSQLG